MSVTARISGIPDTLQEVRDSLAASWAGLTTHGSIPRAVMHLADAAHILIDVTLAASGQPAKEVSPTKRLLAVSRADGLPAVQVEQIRGVLNLIGEANQTIGRAALNASRVEQGIRNLLDVVDWLVQHRVLPVPGFTPASIVSADPSGTVEARDTPRDPESRVQRTSINCLVIMPFSGFDEVFQAAQRAVGACLDGITTNVHWLKDVLRPGRITDDILDGLRGATFCIADLSGGNANVMWETGYAMALGKPTILISQKLESLPFDLRVHRVIPYRTSELVGLEAKLTETVRQMMAAKDLERRRVPFDSGNTGLRVAVTGSMNADGRQVRNRVAALLSPYLPSSPTWYCGSNGVTDECAIEFLLAHQQRVTVVGYNAFDVSAAIHREVLSGRVTFVDASAEPVPRGMNGPTARDVLLAARADLVVLFWDGRSKGTEKLLRFYEGNGNSMLLGFV